MFRSSTSVFHGKRAIRVRTICKISEGSAGLTTRDTAASRSPSINDLAPAGSRFEATLEADRRVRFSNGTESVTSAAI
jgi:hypothetical protein